MAKVFFNLAKVAKFRQISLVSCGATNLTPDQCD